MVTAPPLSAKEVAKEIGTDARTFRKFLREVTPAEDHPGQGGRWTFTRGEATKLTKRFEKWTKESADKAPAAAENGSAPKASKKASKKAAALPEPEELEDELLELEDLDDPDEDDLDDEDLGEDDEDED